MDLKRAKQNPAFIRFSLNFVSFKQKPQRNTLVMLYVCQVCLNNANVRGA